MTGFRITPAEVAHAAEGFAVAHGDLEKTWTALGSALQFQAGMAGNDDFARQFYSRYQRGADAAWAAFGKTADTLDGISRGLTQMANNYLKADHHSAVGISGPPPTVPPAAPSPRPAVGAVCVPAIDSALGPGEPGLPGPLARFWPNAHTDKLRSGARAWHAAGGEIEQIAGHLSAVIGSLTDFNHGADVRAVETFWSRVYRVGDPHTLLDGLPRLCKALGDACDRYADAVDHARSTMKWALAGAGIAIGVTTVVGVAATIFTFGLSDAGAGAADTAEAAAILAPEAEAAAATISAGTEAAVAADLVSAVEAATADAPEVEVVDAETTQVEQALDEELSQAEDGGPAGPVVSDAQKIDNILNPGGKPIGQPGRTPDCRLLEDQQQIDELWNQLKTELGRDPQSFGPGGQIQKIELSDRGYVQYRPWSNTGGSTIDISNPGQPIRIIHIK
jgi:hypothetical protein